MSPADPSGDPDISLVLRGDDDPAAARLKALQQATIAGNGAIPIWQPSRRRDRAAVVAATVNMSATDSPT